MKTKRTKWVILAGSLLFLTLLCNGLLMGIQSQKLTYITAAAVAVFAFAFFAVLTMRQKHLSFYSVMALLIGLLSLASSIVESGYVTTIATLPIEAQGKFYIVLRPQFISTGLFELAMGAFFLLMGSIQITGKHLKNVREQDYKRIKIASICVGIFTIIVAAYIIINAIYILINGLYPAWILQLHTTQ